MSTSCVGQLCTITSPLSLSTKLQSCILGMQHHALLICQMLFGVCAHRRTHQQWTCGAWESSSSSCCQATHPLVSPLSAASYVPQFSASPSSVFSTALGKSPEYSLSSVCGGNKGVGDMYPAKIIPKLAAVTANAAPAEGHVSSKDFT